MASSENSDFYKILEFRLYFINLLKRSSFTSSYIPENIKDIADKLFEIGNHPQFFILELQCPAIVKTINFGTLEKVLVGNIIKFKIYGGLEPENMIELLESELRTDAVQTFHLKHTLKGEENYLPVRYIKILPLHSWGPRFDFDIGHVRLTGIDDPKIVWPSIEWLETVFPVDNASDSSALPTIEMTRRQTGRANYFQYRQKEVVRLCMKHFRRLEQPEIVETLRRVTGVQLEDPRLSVLYDLLVTKGDYSETEQFISNAIMMGLLNEYINAQTYRALWTKLSSNEPKPGMRGGHQMVLDPSAEVLYLFGGWDGNQDLSDLWSYSIAADKWTLICRDTETVGGPSARSCHKMCLDPERRQLFTLGKYLDAQYRRPENLKSDFYVYDIESNKWSQISEDTAVEGGPQLIYDHQMSMDVEKQTIYVFGGRVLVSPTSSEEHGLVSSSTEPIFSGLYSYHVPSGIWKKLACDILLSNDQISCAENVPRIRCRSGHSMLFHPGPRKLYILAGQRGKTYLSDFFTYEVDTNHIEHISYNRLIAKESNHVPAAGFAQRATFDPDLGEIYVLSGLSKDKGKRDGNVQSSLWVYNIKSNRWSCIYRNENVGEKYWSNMQDFEPCPRFAHQLVYDHVNKVHFLFGGNPGRSCLPNLRLNDFWKLELCRPSHEEILKKCKLIIRKQKFEELALSNSIEALEYLQTKVSEIIDHNDIEQTNEFQMLTSVLFRKPNSLEEEAEESNSVPSTLGNTTTESVSAQSSNYYRATRNVHVLRTELYDKLTEFFPKSLTEPRANLIDLPLRCNKD